MFQRRAPWRALESWDNRRLSIKACVIEHKEITKPGLGMEANAIQDDATLQSFTLEGLFERWKELVVTWDLLTKPVCKKIQVVSCWSRQVEKN